jgi:hypothetical protein
MSICEDFVLMREYAISDSQEKVSDPSRQALGVYMSSFISFHL